MIAVVIALVCFHQLWMWRGGRRFDVFDVRVLSDAVLLVMFVWAPLVQPEVKATTADDFGFVLTTTLGIAALYVGMEVFGHRGSDGTARWKCEEFIRRGPLWLGTIAFCVLTLVLVGQYLRLSGTGFSAWFASDRTALVTTEGGAAVYQLVEASRPLALLLLAHSVMARRWWVAGALYCVLLGGILAIFQTRLQVLITLALPLVAYHYRVRRLRVPSIAIGLVLFVGGLFVLNVWRGEGIAAVREAEVSPASLVESVAVNFSPIVAYSQLWAMHRRGVLDYEHGMTYVYVPLVPIPRAIWPGKPRVSFEPRWNAKLFGDEIPVVDGARGVWTFTAWGEGLTQFGLPGVALNLFLYGGLLGWLQRLAVRQPPFFLIVFYYGVIAATYLRSSFTSLLVGLMIAFVPVGLAYTASRPRITRVLRSDGTASEDK